MRAVCVRVRVRVRSVKKSTRSTRGRVGCEALPPHGALLPYMLYDLQMPCTGRLTSPAAKSPGSVELLVLSPGGSTSPPHSPPDVWL
eukprot:3947310-Pyramimonas_sp.AAC.1